uniref:Uncharacterized protein n=1 Tax=Leersia perrieri TaxID=77586 RepID=A0A0D9VXF5_9ORYZ
MVSRMDEKDRAKLADMNIDGIGLLQVAAHMGKIEVIRYFVEELGFDVDAGSLCGGSTALGSATLFGEVDTVRYLLAHGYEEVVRLLLSSGARVDIAVAYGTPLHIAVSYGKTGAVKILLDHHADAGADVNYACPNTSLVIATTNGLTDCIKYLLEVHTDPNIPDKQSGRTPIEIAASFGRRDHVEILFPFTSPVKAVINWTVEEIIAHGKSRRSMPKDEARSKINDKKAKLKSLGEKAVKRKDYFGASKIYSEALELDYFDATLYSNRSLCYLQIGEAQKALLDAQRCVELRPDWVKGHYREGGALMLLKEHKKAFEAFLNALKLDPANEEIEKVLWEAVEAMKKDHFDDFGFRVGLALRRGLPYLNDAGPQSEFFDAATRGDVRRLRELASGKDAEGKAWLADTPLSEVGPLQAAARLGEVDACRCMVEELGLDINATGLAGHDEVARLLLSRGASVDIAYFHGTPLHIAAAYGKDSVMKVLLEHHADPNKVSEVLGTPLVATLHSTSQGLAESISLKCVKLLVEAGADVNYSDRDTPLVVAITNGLTNCIKYLLKAGADPNIPTCHDKQDHQNEKAQLKLHGEKAVKRKDYCGASNFYTEAIELDSTDATLYSNRSLCHLQMTDAVAALFDADTCIGLRPEWLKGYYRKGAALMEAVEAMKKHHLETKGFK